MPAGRFYTPEQLDAGGQISLLGDEAHHLTRALRAAPGDAIELVNGQGVLATAEVIQPGKREAHVKVTALSTQPNDPPLILAQALPRQGRLTTVLEKGTELGATAFWLFPAERGERTTLSSPQRARAVTIAAMKQCGRLHLPQITLKPPLADWEELPCPSFYGSTAPDAPPFSPPTTEVLFVIGPESGLTPAEEKHLEALGARGVKLHHNILRTDTAGLVALSLIGQARF